MEREDGMTTGARSAEAAELIQITKRALDAQSIEDQRAHVDHADIAHTWINTPGDTLDLSNRNARALPVEVIELIKDRIERWVPRLHYQ